jgi:hypothetical protein
MGQNPNLLSICEGAMNMNFGFYKFEKKIRILFSISFIFFSNLVLEHWKYLRGFRSWESNLGNWDQSSHNLQ